MAGPCHLPLACAHPPQRAAVWPRLSNTHRRTHTRPHPPPRRPSCTVARPSRSRGSRRCLAGRWPRSGSSRSTRWGPTESRSRCGRGPRVVLAGGGRRDRPLFCSPPLWATCMGPLWQLAHRRLWLEKLMVEASPAWPPRDSQRRWACPRNAPPQKCAARQPTPSCPLSPGLASACCPADDAGLAGGARAGPQGSGGAGPQCRPGCGVGGARGGAGWAGGGRGWLQLVTAGCSGAAPSGRAEQRIFQREGRPGLRV